MCAPSSPYTHVHAANHTLSPPCFACWEYLWVSTLPTQVRDQKHKGCTDNALPLSARTVRPVPRVVHLQQLQSMRVLTWNVNGLRAVLNRRFGSTRSLLKYLKAGARTRQLRGFIHILYSLVRRADIICLQETKLSKVDMTRFQDLALSEGW